MIIKIDGFNTKIHPDSKVMDTAVVSGQVEMKQKSSVWFSAVVRGDRDKVVIGEYTCIQDGSVIHTHVGQPTIIGDYVVVGHGAMLHGCTIEDRCMIGIGAIILDDCVIGTNSIIAAGTVVPPGKIIPPHSVVMGNPAVIKRQITQEESDDIIVVSKRYYDLLAQYY